MTHSINFDSIMNELKTVPIPGKIAIGINGILGYRPVDGDCPAYTGWDLGYIVTVLEHIERIEDAEYVKGIVKEYSDKLLSKWYKVGDEVWVLAPGRVTEVHTDGIPYSITTPCIPTRYPEFMIEGIRAEI